MNKVTQKKCIPFILTILCFVLDQVTKNIIAANIPLGQIGTVIGNNIIRIVHVANTGIAFSIGDSLPQTTRSLLFSLLPLVALVFVIVIYFRNNEFTDYQRWCICGVLGGGFGNVYDRLFRAEGVIDFIDVKFWGLFGLDRWPTFNVADMTVVICGCLLLISFMTALYRENQ